ncbi:MAG: hypothetical protein ACRCV9_04950 [Burkholderiaceae bacterium]
MNSRTSVFNLILGRDVARLAMLEGGERLQSRADSLRAKRDELIDALKSFEPFAERIKVAERRAACMQLVDMAISAAEAFDSADGSDRSMLTSISMMQQLQKITPGSGIELMTQYAFAACAPVVGARYASQAHVHLDQVNGLTLLSRNRTIVGAYHAAAAKAVCGELAAMNQNDSRWGTVDLSRVENALSQMLDEWSTMPVGSMVAAQLDFIRLFVQRVVGALDANVGFWEMLLLKLERYMARQGERLHYAPISTAIESLLAATPRFGFLRLFSEQFAVEFPNANALLHLLLVRMVLDARAKGNLTRRFGALVNPLALLEAGFQPDKAELASSRMKAVLRDKVERAQLDWMTDAWQSLIAIGQAVPDSAQLIKDARPAIERLASQLVEGVSDSAGRKRVIFQLEGLLTEALICGSVSQDPLEARARFRSTVAPYLDVERDPGIWKKHRQISAGLMQLEVESTAAQRLYAKAQTLLAEIANIVPDLLGISLDWVGKTLAKDDKALPSHFLGDATCMVVTAIIARRLYGERGQPAIGRSLTQLLFAHNQRPNLANLRADFLALAVKLESSEAPREIVALLRGAVQRMPSYTSAVRLISEIDDIATAISESGPPRYAEHLRTNPADEPRGGSAKSWQLGVADNTFSMGRLAYLLMRGVDDVSNDLNFWWSIGVAKNITAVPRPFMAMNLKIMLQELVGRMPSDEAFTIFAPISSLYKSAFGVAIEDTGSNLALFAPARMRGAWWEAVFATSVTTSAVGRHYEAAEQLFEERAPALLHQVATGLVTSFSQLGDEELVWQRLMPAMFSAIEQFGAAQVERAWLEWIDRARSDLPLGAAAFWVHMLSNGLNLLRQVAFARQIAQRAAKFSADLQPRMASVWGSDQKANELIGAVAVMVSRLSVTLLSEPPSLATTNVLRRLILTGGPAFDLTSEQWNRFWVAFDDTVRPKLDVCEQAGLNRWITQQLGSVQWLPEISKYVVATLLDPQPVFAESMQEESDWRECISSLLVSAATPDYLPVAGSMMVRRLLLSSPVLGNESAKSWNERRQALEQTYEESFSPSLREAMAASHGQLVAGLLDMGRIREAGALEPAHQWGVAFSSVQACQFSWQLSSFARQYDSEKFVATHDDTFAAMATRTQAPDARRCDYIASQVKAARTFACPAVLRRKKLFGSDEVKLEGAFSTQIPRMVWAASVRSALGGHRVREAIFEFTGAWHSESDLMRNLDNVNALFDPKFDSSFSGTDSTLLQKTLLPAMPAIVASAKAFSERVSIARDAAKQAPAQTSGAMALVAYGITMQLCQLGSGLIDPPQERTVGEFLRVQLFANVRSVAEPLCKRLESIYAFSANEQGTVKNAA